MIDRRALLGLVALGLGAAHVVLAADPAPVRVVYHVADGLPQATRALRQLKNHRRADPAVQIVVVALSDGIDFLLQDAVDDGNYPYALLVEPLAAEGVQFRVCRNTLDARLIERSRVLDGVEIVPSGIAEIARLQAHEGYVYVRP
ncbi:MAG: DsrE family protein [Gammaproteobacteria bacterium]